MENIIHLSGWGIVLLLLLLVEILDWKARFEMVERDHPWLWKIINNRPARLVLIVVAIAFLAKDFRDIAAIAPAPVVKINTLPPPQLAVAGMRNELTIDPVAIARALVAIQKQQQAPQQSPRKTKMLRVAREVLLFAKGRASLEFRPVDPAKVTDQGYMNKRWMEGVRLSQETDALYKVKYAGEVLAVLQDARAQGMNIGNMEWDCAVGFAGYADTHGLTVCGIRLNALAEGIN